MLATIGVMIVAMSLIPLGDTAGKLLTQAGIAPFFIAWARFVVGAVMLAPVRGAGLRNDLKLLTDWRVWLRALLIVGGICSILTALQSEPIANVFGAFFVGPIVSFALSALLLGERVTLWRSLLMGVGFCGVLLVVKPGFGMTPGLAFAVLAGVFYGAYLVASRWLAGIAAPTALMLSQLVVGALVLAPFGLLAWPELDLWLVGLLVWSAAASMLGNLLLIRAYGWTSASALAPFVYFQLIAATGLGMLVFGDVPDGYALAGLALLILSGAASVGRRTVR
jgi:drug/metabolite transporter (DMT)-like permease